ncbi:hypothetical protein ERJ75_001785800 [Trypanosoma vivax]|nr:hypothetical protein ERJ75_001785800 [Trypanosoma vivax]
MLPVPTRRCQAGRRRSPLCAPGAIHAEDRRVARNGSRTTHRCSPLAKPPLALPLRVEAMRCATVAVAARELLATPGRSRRVRVAGVKRRRSAASRAWPACRGGCRFPIPTASVGALARTAVRRLPKRLRAAEAPVLFARDLQTPPTAADHNARWRGSATRTAFPSHAAR